MARTAIHEDRRGPTPASDARPLATATLAELLASYVAVLDELRARRVVRTGKVVGDYAEALVARALRLDLAAGPTEGYDATDHATGERYQIKARRIGRVWRDVGMGPFRGLDEDLFDVFVGVVFDVDLSVIRALRVPRPVVVTNARPVAYDGTHRLQVGPRLAAVEGVTDITALLHDTVGAWVLSGSAEGRWT